LEWTSPPITFIQAGVYGGLTYNVLETQYWLLLLMENSKRYGETGSTASALVITQYQWLAKLVYGAPNRGPYLAVTPERFEGEVISSPTLQ